MDNTKELQKAINELKHLTGLSLELNSDSREDPSYAVNQINLLISAYKEKNTKHSILKKWITGDITAEELNYTAKRFHLPLAAPRALFLIETIKDMDDSVLTILKHEFPDSSKVFFVPMTPRQAAMVYTFPKNISDKVLSDTAFLVMNILNAEALVQVKISFSSVTSHLNQLPKACQEATLALNAGKIFYPDQIVYSYNQLGIGRLIYGISREKCYAFLKETIGTTEIPSVFQSDTIHAVNCFLNTNLNIAETARQLHMHRNTFIYRLEQIEKETGLDVRQFHDAMTFKTALFVINYLQSK